MSSELHSNLNKLFSVIQCETPSTLILCFCSLLLQSLFFSISRSILWLKFRWVFKSIFFSVKWKKDSFQEKKTCDQITEKSFVPILGLIIKIIWFLCEWNKPCLFMMTSIQIMHNNYPNIVHISIVHGIFLVLAFFFIMYMHHQDGAKNFFMYVVILACVTMCTCECLHRMLFRSCSCKSL